MMQMMQILASRHQTKASKPGIHNPNLPHSLPLLLPQLNPQSYPGPLNHHKAAYQASRQLPTNNNNPYHSPHQNDRP